MRKKQRSIFLTALLTGLLVAISFSSIYGWSPWKKKDSTNESSQEGKGIFGVTKHSNGNTTVDLTPLSYEDGKLIVKISVNTHNVDDLDKYNLKEITKLETGSRAIKPVSTPSLGGHHNSGKIVFEVDVLPEKFSIGITGLDSPDKREFSWP
ncbi:hypothetical protein KKA14_05635 [bacterium]|nr:hypothetical protein [bacterium]